MVDAHVHVFERNPHFPFAPGAHAPAEDAPPEKLIALMRANGVARTVIIQVIHYKWDNSFLASVLKRYPTLFHGVCRVNPEDPAAPDQLTRLTEEGFRGVRLSPAADATGDWIRGPLMPPLWRRCNELKVPMTVLVPATRLPDLVPLIEANPELTVVIDHMADCPLEQALQCAAADVGDELARLSRATALRKDRRALPRPHELPQSRGTGSHPEQDRATRLALRAVNARSILLPFS